jgi:mycothiol synthase
MPALGLKKWCEVLVDCRTFTVVAGEVRIAEEDLGRLASEDLDAVVDFEAEPAGEEEPGDPAEPPDLVAWRLFAAPAGFRCTPWTARSPDGSIIGLAGLEVSTVENLDLGEVYLKVRPAWRRRGIGSDLLRRLVARAQQDGRHHLVGHTTERVPAGEAFANHLGGLRELVEVTSQLDLARVDQALLERWVSVGRRLRDRYELWSVDGPYPVDEYSAIGEIQNAMNSAPRGERDDVGFSAERVAHQRGPTDAGRTLEPVCPGTSHRQVGRLHPGVVA